MERIGIVASKIAKGNLFLYNFFVLLLVALFSLMVFFITGSAIVVILLIAAYFTNAASFPDLESSWMAIMIVALSCLFFIVSCFSFFAIIKNLKFRKNK